MDIKTASEMKVETIHMRAPAMISDHVEKRQALDETKEIKDLIEMEAFLRRKAYKNTSIKVSASFFDDSDMKSDYYLVLVYEKNVQTPLLSARHFFDKQLIAKYLRGEGAEAPDLWYQGLKFDLENFSDGSIFLADRLSGNVNTVIYRRHHQQLFTMYYDELVKTNKNCTLLLMVRKEKRDQQLNKYLSLGFAQIGSTMHKGKEHSIIICELKYA